MVDGAAPHPSPASSTLAPLPEPSPNELSSVHVEVDGMRCGLLLCVVQCPHLFMLQYCGIVLLCGSSLAVPCDECDSSNNQWPVS